MNGKEEKRREIAELVKKSEDWDKKAREFLSKKKSNLERRARRLDAQSTP